MLKSASVYQTLLAQQAEEQGIAHFPQVLEAHGLQLSILNDVFQLVVKELQDSCEETQDAHSPLLTSSVQSSRRQLHDSFLQHTDVKWRFSIAASFILFLFTASMSNKYKHWTNIPVSFDVSLFT